MFESKVVKRVIRRHQTTFKVLRRAKTQKGKMKFRMDAWQLHQIRQG